MPPFGMHITVARQLAGRIGRKAVDAEPGAYYLGATAPDIRVITKWDRSRTHFFDLDDFGHQRGASRVFEEHPDLTNASCLNDATVAFLCGYISHLEMDEAWINIVYRPCFGERSPLKGEALANVLDRLLQFELDKRERGEGIDMAHVRDDLLASSVEVATPFLERERLLEWRDVSADVVARPPDTRRLAGRHLRAYGLESDDDIDHFLRNVPDLLDQALREVTTERIDEFFDRARAGTLESIEEHLS